MLNLDISQQKKKLRVQMLQKRNHLNSLYKQQYDHFICEKLIELVNNNNYQFIHTYLPMGSEINVSAFINFCIQTNRTVVSPKTLKNRTLEHYQLKSLQDTALGLYNAPYPTNTHQYTDTYDVIIVPGLAFSHSKQRLGYGGGYYDTFLAQHQTAQQVGVCYPFQYLETIPVEEHDACIDTILVHKKT